MNTTINPRPNGFFTFVLALFPGIAHLYIGLTKKGLALLGSFVGLVIFAILLNFASYISAILVLPMILVYFYSFFDALKQRRIILAGEQAEDSDYLTQFYQSFFNKTPGMNATILRFSGILLLIVGIAGILGSISSRIPWDAPFRIYYNLAVSMLLPAALVLLGIVLIRKGVKK